MLLPLREPILFLAHIVSVVLNVTVRYWLRLDGVLHVNAIFALVLAIANGTILLRVTDAKADSNVSAIFLFWMGIVQNALWLIVRAIRLFAFSVFRSMNVIANASLIAIKLTRNAVK